MSDDGGIQHWQTVGQEQELNLSVLSNVLNGFRAGPSSPDNVTGTITRQTKEEDMSNNMALWERAFITDPRAVKEITGKQYKGSSPNPYWVVKRLTEEFGPAGHGWGMEVVNDRMERLTDTDVLHVARVRLWYVLDGKRGELEQMGQTKAAYMTKAGAMMIDEDAPKKSVTDALVKCASYIGFCGDIFSGRWDDSSYVASAREHYDEKENGPDYERIIGTVRNATDAKVGRANFEAAMQMLPAGMHPRLVEASKARAAELKAA